ncbi:hypothetical protein RRG08_041859 [Elysia crispata]|uniref:RING-type domain-containing protein n=1 Tax=Elysia crispata TaxID=231223 RepID=A0AAE0Y0Q9_9GAST|nr:hypothetical protein RRG08_041859 [Elysia crispata]
MEATEAFSGHNSNHRKPMASVASPSVLEGLKRTLSGRCCDQSSDNSSIDPILDIFGNPVFLESCGEETDLPSRRLCGEFKTKIQDETQLTNRQIRASSCSHLASNSVPSDYQFLDKKEVDSNLLIKSKSGDNKAVPEVEILVTDTKDYAAMTTSPPKPLGARPKVFSHTKGQTRSKSQKRRKTKNELCAENVNDCKNEQKTSRAKSKTKKKKVRTNANKKWKPVDITEFGFNFSLISRLDLDEDDADTDNDTAGNEYPEEPVCVSNGDNDSSDDAEFFLSLGINVFEDYGDSGAEPFLNWNGVSLSIDADPSLQTVTPKSHKRQESSGKEKIKLKSTESKSSPYKEDNIMKENKKPLLKRPKCFMRHVDNRIRKSDKYSLYELECSSRKKVYIRRDKQRRVEKAHKAVKSKNCVSIFNNRGKKKLYMHHRLVKMHDLCLDFRSSSKRLPLPPKPKWDVDLNSAKQIFKANHNTGRVDRARPAPVQNLRHTIDENNTPNHLDFDLASFLISLQHREMTPEDYDMLLRLDDTVKPKTVSMNVLETLKTDIVGPGDVGKDDEIVLCAICMDPYISGDKRKFLPCGHDFHASCVDTWLKNSSMNCPLDGLPVDSS